MKKIEYHSGNGEVVRGKLFEPPGEGKHPALLLTHGLLSAHQEFGDYPDRLAEAGYVALAIDQRGHGESAGVRGYVTHARGVEDVRRGLDFLLAQLRVDPARVALVGHSLGAAISVCAAADDSRVKALVAIAPPASIAEELKPGEKQLYAVVSAAGKLYRTITRSHLYVPYRVGVDQIFHHAGPREAARQAGFLQNRAPVEAAGVLSTEGGAITCAPRVKVPALVLSGEHDRVVASARRVYEALGGPKQFVQIDDSGHSIMTDGRGKEAFEVIAKWLAENL